jgi:hypothetical protein
MQSVYESHSPMNCDHDQRFFKTFLLLLGAKDFTSYREIAPPIIPPINPKSAAPALRRRATVNVASPPNKASIGPILISP